MNAIELIGLRKCYESTVAVESLTLTVPEGCRLALLGVNGAGKTTTIGMLTGLIQPTAGQALIFGHIAGSPEAKAMIGLSPQQTAIAPNLTVKENITFMAEVYGAKEAETRAKELMETFGLTEFAKRKAKHLSGGYQRRLSIAMALVHNPKLLFLDEPTLGLDVLARRELHRQIASLNTTLVLTTHYMEEAAALADLVAVMHRGRLLAVDSPESLMTKTGTDNLEGAFVALTEELL